MNEDILQDVKNEDLKQLRDLFLKDWPKHIHSYMFIENWIRLKESDPKLNVEITCPNGIWNDGTFIAIITEKTYSLAFHTLQKSCDRLTEALKNTKRIDWKKGPYIYTIHGDIQEPCLKILRNLEQSIEYEVTSQCLYLSKENSLKLKINLPKGFKILPLSPEHGSTIFLNWRYTFLGADKYIPNLIKISDGFGIFEDTSHKLCSWIMINEYGVFGILHTIDEYQRRGFAKEIVKFMAIYRAKKGLDSIANVDVKNSVSEKLFYSVGFQKVHNVKWVQFKQE